jgi:hypothetical protein
VQRDNEWINSSGDTAAGGGSGVVS